jgi:aerotaxis receptor
LKAGEWFRRARLLMVSPVHGDYRRCQAETPLIVLFRFPGPALSGAVKNRRKNGDFYWVLATASPIQENGRITGYTSIRTKLPADQRREAEHVYALLRGKKAQDYRIDAGVIRRRSLLDRVAFFTRTLNARLITLVATLGLFMLTIGLAGILSTRDSNTRMKSIYEDRAVPLAQLFEINDRMKDNTIAQYDAAANGRAGKPIGDIAGRVAGNIETISKVWAEYMATYLTPEEKSVADTFTTKRKNYVENAVKPALALLADRKYDEAGALLAGKASELFASAKQELDKLVAIQVKEAKVEYDAAEHQYVIVIGIAAALLTIGLLLGGLFGRQTIQAIVRPLQLLNETMFNITRGKLDSRILVERDDETGVALRNLQTLQAIIRFDREELKATEQRSAVQRKSDMVRLANGFEGAVGEIIETVSSAATELEASAGTLTSTAERAQELTTMVAAASEEASTNVQSVASATEEMSSSVNEISRQVQDSARMANEAVDQARKTNDRVGELSKAAARIGDVVELINTIAGQTNLLALNATIEAARAGEAGRGFAVVASEVKALAEQTAKATGEIGQQIAGIQAATQESVNAIKEISGTIEKLSEISSTIAAAVEEQGAATQEISRNVQQAAQGTQQVSSHITDVQRGASETGLASSQVLSAAKSLSSDSNRLKLEVGKFLDTVRAA